MIAPFSPGLLPPLAVGGETDRSHDGGAATEADGNLGLGELNPNRLGREALGSAG